MSGGGAGGGGGGGGVAGCVSGAWWWLMLTQGNRNTLYSSLWNLMTMHLWVIRRCCLGRDNFNVIGMEVMSCAASPNVVGAAKVEEDAPDMNHESFPFG